jgi:hypothetical protein
MSGIFSTSFVRPQYCLQGSKDGIFTPMAPRRRIPKPFVTRHLAGGFVSQKACFQGPLPIFDSLASPLGGEGSGEGYFRAPCCIEASAKTDSSASGAGVPPVALDQS